MIRRRCGECILLGENIEIQVLEVTGNRVKIGISAPRELLVLRKELRLTAEFNVEASRGGHPGSVRSLAESVRRSQRRILQNSAPAP